MKKKLSFIFLFVMGVSMAQDAQKIVKQYIDAVGGKKNIEAVKSVLQKGEVEQMGQVMEFEIYQNTNGDGYMKMNMAGMSLVLYAVKDGKGFRINEMMGYDEMPEEEVKESQKKNKKIFGDVIYALDDKDKMKYLGKEEMEGKKYDVVELSSEEGEKVKVYFDPDTHLIKYTVVETENGPVVNEIASYKEVNGIKFPEKMLTKVGGQTVTTMTFTDIIVNPTPDQIDQEAFIMPE